MQHACEDRLKHLWTERQPSNVFLEAEKIHLWTQLWFPLNYPNTLKEADETTALSPVQPRGKHTSALTAVVVSSSQSPHETMTFMVPKGDLGDP